MSWKASTASARRLSSVADRSPGLLEASLQVGAGPADLLVGEGGHLAGDALSGSAAAP